MKTSRIPNILVKAMATMMAFQVANGQITVTIKAVFQLNATDQMTKPEGEYTCIPNDRPKEVKEDLEDGGSLHNFVPPKPFRCNEKCGKWDGSETPPFLALVHGRPAEEGSVAPKCSGVLVSNKHVVSLASCLCKEAFCSEEKQHDVKTEEVEEGTAQPKVVLQGSEVSMDVAKVDYHPLFVHGNPKLDLAVLTLKKAVDNIPICLPPPLAETYYQGEKDERQTLQLNWLDYNWDVDAVNDEMSYVSTLNMCCSTKLGQDGKNRGPWCHLPGRDINSRLNTATKFGSRRHSLSRLMIASSGKEDIKYPCVGMPYGPVGTALKNCKDRICQEDKEELKKVECDDLTLCKIIKDGNGTPKLRHTDLVLLNPKHIGSCTIAPAANDESNVKRGLCRRDWCDNKGTSYQLEIETVFGPWCDEKLKNMAGEGEVWQMNEFCGVLTHPFNFLAIKDTDYFLINVNEVNTSDPKRPDPDWNPDLRKFPEMDQLATGVKGGIVTKAYKDQDDQLDSDPRYYLTGIATHGGILNGQSTEEEEEMFPFTIFRYIRFHNWLTVLTNETEC